MAAGRPRRRTRLRKEFGGLVATDDVDFTIPRGSIVALIGPNGAGKTTFFNQLTGVYKPTSGSIVFDGTEVVATCRRTRSPQLGIGRTFQNIRLFSQMTALENVLVGMHCRLAQRHPRLDPPDAAGEARGGRGARPRARAARRTAGCRGGTTSARATSRTATSVGSRWRARSRPTRSSSSSTSRRPA